jgi:DNA-binding SARP family transcriptional activator
MFFRLFGVMEAVHAGESLRLGPRQRRLLLAVLLLKPGRPVSFDRLMRLVWEGDPPASARVAIQVHVSHLRKVLGSVDAPGVPEIVTLREGYVAHADPLAVDVHRFRDLIGKARAAADEEAVRLYRSAFALWRGEPLADLGSVELPSMLLGGLQEAKVIAVEDCFERELRLGRHAEVVPELRDLVTEQPGRSRMVGQLMLALYRNGRQGEALEVYRRVRARQSDELGLDPAPSLRRLETAILGHDPALLLR